MDSLDVCECCGQKIPVLKLWLVVTTEIFDGHPVNAYFISENKDIVSDFIDVVYPNVVRASCYASLDEAKEFVVNNFEDFEEIDPVAIICAASIRE